MLPAMDFFIRKCIRRIYQTPFSLRNSPYRRLLFGMKLIPNAEQTTSGADQWIIYESIFRYMLRITAKELATITIRPVSFTLTHASGVWSLARRIHRGTCVFRVNLFICQIYLFECLMRPISSSVTTTSFNILRFIWHLACTSVCAKTNGAIKRRCSAQCTHTARSAGQIEHWAQEKNNKKNWEINRDADMAPKHIFGMT